MMRLGLLVVVLVALVSRVSSAAEAKPPVPVERYDFHCAPGEPVRAIQGTGSILGALVAKPVDSFACSSTGVGIRPSQLDSTFETAQLDQLPHMTTEHTMAALQEHLAEATGITVELWVALASSVFTEHALRLPILSVGIPTRNAPASPDDQCGSSHSVWGESSFRGGYDLQLMAVSSGVALESEETHTCRGSLVPFPWSGGMTQLVWSQSASDLQFFVNGQQVVHTRDSRFLPNLDDWDPTYAMHLFSEWTQTQTYPAGPHRFFPGTIYGMSLYDVPLGLAQVDAAYESGLFRIRNTIQDNLSRSMAATPWNNITLEQGSVGPVVLSLGSNGTVQGDWITYVEIVSGPRRGKLLQQQLDGAPIAIGSRLAIPPGRARTTILYMSSTSGSFTVPNKRAGGAFLTDLPAPDSFDFRLVAIDRDTHEVLGTSESATQLVNIRNTNRPPVWKAPIVVNQTASSVDDPSSPTAIEGIELLDPDKNVNWVRVTISAVNGTVQLDPTYEYLALVCPLNLDRYWQCQGIGIEDKQFTFLAEPDDVKLILDKLRFRPDFQMSPGIVVLDAYDGVNQFDADAGECIDVAEQNYVVLADSKTVVSSVQIGCFHAQAIVYVTASARLEELRFLQKKFLGISYGAWIRYAVYAVSICFVLSVAKCLVDFWMWCFCGRRDGAEVGVDDP